MAGGLGNDIYYLDNAGDSIIEAANQGTDTVRSSVSVSLATQHIERIELTGGAAVNVSANALANTLIGNSASNSLNGGSGNDSLSGELGNDILIGGAGTDQLQGGGGADMFDFNAVTDSLAGSSRDVIQDFVRGSDRIDVATIDANGNSMDGNQAFTFIGSGAFAGSAGQLRFVNGILQGDINGDKIADFDISIVGQTAMSSTDLIL